MLKAGLVSAKQAKQSAHKRRVDNREKGQEALQQEAHAARQQVVAQQAAERERDRLAGVQRAELLAARAREAGERQHRQATLENLFAHGEMEQWGGPRTYFYAHGKRIEALQVNDETGRRLEEGQAAIAAKHPDGQQATVLIASAARKLRELAPEQVLCFHESA